MGGVPTRPPRVAPGPFEAAPTRQRRSWAFRGEATGAGTGDRPLPPRCRGYPRQGRGAEVTTTDYNRSQARTGPFGPLENEKSLGNPGTFALSCFRRPLLYPVELQAQIFRCQLIMTILRLP